jgi:hypothetical protein
VLRNQRRLDGAGGGRLVAAAQREHLGDVAPVGLHALREPRLLRRLTHRRGQLLLEPGRFRQILTHPLERRLPSREWIRLGAVDHVAHQHRE